MGRPKKPGRKPAPKDTKRAVRLVVLVTPAERNALEAKARAAGRPLTTWMRETLVNGNGTGARLAELEGRVEALEGKTTPPADPGDLPGAILAAFAHLDSLDPGRGFVGIPALRRAVPGACGPQRDAFDRALRDLQRGERLEIHKQNDLRDVTPADEQDMLRLPLRGLCRLVSKGARYGARS